MNFRSTSLLLLLGFGVCDCLGIVYADEPKNSGWNAGLDLGEPLRDWLVLKPIPVHNQKKGPPDEAARRKAFDRDWLAPAGGELAVQPRNRAKVKIEGHTLSWTVFNGDRGTVDLQDKSRPVEHALAYAWTEFELPGVSTVVLGIGSDDSVKVWLNGRLVHENWTTRGVRLDDDLVPVRLQPGKNSLLLKVQNGVGPWGFACCVMSTAQADALKSARAHQANINEPLIDNQIQDVLRDYIEIDKLGVGMVVGLIDEHGPRIISSGNMSSLGPGEVNGDTIFEIGSVTKVFTALLLQDMLQRGQMSLDDPVQKYLPDTVRLPAFEGKEITLLHLATHTSGLPRNASNATPRTWRDPDENYSIKKFYQFLSGWKLRQAPGTKEEYSNVGVALLGHVIELKAGKDYETLLLERICRPLGMNSTRVTLTPELKARLATGHVIPGSAVCSASVSVPGAGAIKSSANDLLRFMAAYCGLTPSPLRTVMDALKTEYPLESGRKRRLVWDGQGSVFEHGGLTYGYKTELALNMEKRRGVVILSNCAKCDLVDKCWRPLLEGRELMPSDCARLDSSNLDQYVGLYETDRQERCLVRRERTRLLVRWLGAGAAQSDNLTFEIFPQQEGVFCNYPWWHNQLIQISFIEHGDRTRMILATDQFCIKATRVSMFPPDTPNPLRLDAGLCARYTGRYRMALLGMIKFGPTLRVLHESDAVGEHLVAYLSGPGADALLNRLGTGGLPGGELFPMDERTFMVPFADVPLRSTFLVNKKGKTTGMIINLGSTRLKGVRIGD